MRIYLVCFSYDLVNEHSCVSTTGSVVPSIGADDLPTVVISEDNMEVTCPISDRLLEQIQNFLEGDRQMITNMYCCAFCGVTGFGGGGDAHKNFYEVPAPLKPNTGAPKDPPYGVCNSFLKSRCFSADKKSW